MRTTITILLILSALFLLSSCGMTNEEIVKETKYCTDNGMEGRILSDGFDNIRAVQCTL